MKYYVARDENGNLYLYNSYPTKDTKAGYWYLYSEDETTPLNKSDFPEVKWSDKEPTEVEILIKKK